MTVQYAGAKNPMFLIRDKELTIYKATKQAIGENPYTNRSTYENNEIKVQKGDLLYLFSDGYADQFGGEENKKFKDIRFWKMLIAICDKPMDEQKQIIHETLEQWKGSNEQVDDILVIGIRIV